jgi:hypothetical protein
VRSDFVFHPPSGSNVPGKIEANPFVFYPPDELRRLIETEEDTDELAKMKSALKQWERIYVFPGYPWKKSSDILRIAALKIIAVGYQQQNPEYRNLDYYQDIDAPEGYEGILEGLTEPYDNYNMKRDDYARQGERPIRDIDTGHGDFLTPSDPVIDKGVVKPRGDGADPEGMDWPPYTIPGGVADNWPDSL